MSIYLHTGTAMLNQLVAYVQSMITAKDRRNEYGSDLERYIISHQPQSIYDVEQLTRQFDTQLSQGLYK